MNVTSNNLAAPAPAPASAPAPAPGLDTDPAAAQAPGAAPLFALLLAQQALVPALPAGPAAADPADAAPSDAAPSDAASADAAPADTEPAADKDKAGPAPVQEGMLLAAMTAPLVLPAALAALPATAAPTAAPQGAAASAGAQAGVAAVALASPGAALPTAAPQSAAEQQAGQAQAAPQIVGAVPVSTQAPSAAPATPGAQPAATAAPTSAPAQADAVASVTAQAPRSNGGGADAGGADAAATDKGSANTAGTPAFGVAAPAAGSPHRAAEALALPGPPPAWRQPLREALGERLQMQLGGGVDQAVIRLDPPMLGRVEIAIRHAAGSLEVSLTATHSEVVRQLQTVSENLRSDLSGRQYTEVAVTVAQAPRAAASGSGTAGFADSQGRRQQGGQAQEDAEPGRALADAGDPTSPFFFTDRASVTAT